MLRKISLFMLFTIVWSYQKFQMLIPNGDAVPNPCAGQSGIWGGVGHNVAAGGGLNNQFGLVRFKFITISVNSETFTCIYYCDFVIWD